MKRTLAGSSVLVLAILLALLLAGCGGGDDETDGSERDRASTASAGTESAAPSGSADSSGSADPSASTGQEAEPETETYARGAEVADFCAAMAEIDTAIDEASEGSEADWKRIVAAFDGLGEVGVPDDLPASGVTEISEVDLLVRQSDSVAELNAAAEDYRPESRTIDDYLEDSCS